MGNAVGRLLALPGVGEADLPPLICRRPRCNEPAVGSGQGRRREFCTDTCRRLLSREREQIRAHVAGLRHLADQYGVLDALEGPAAGHPPPPSPQRVQQPGAARSALAHLALELDLVEALVQDGLESGSPVSAAAVVSRLRLAKRQADRLMMAGDG